MERLGTDIDAVLDDPVGQSLHGPHADFAHRAGRASVYAADVATFAAVPPEPSTADWRDLASLLGGGGFADLFSSPATPPPDWEPVFLLEGLQMVGGDTHPEDAERDPDVVHLRDADVPEMLDLAGRTRPGPFWRRTIEMGTYVGIREHGRLVAMAGERLHPPGWTEISAVCTTPEARGRGFAARLVRSVAAGIAARGERPFLHLSADNAVALALYRRLGFEVRRPVTFRGFRTPG